MKIYRISSHPLVVRREEAEEEEAAQIFKRPNPLMYPSSMSFSIKSGD